MTWCWCPLLQQEIYERFSFPINYRQIYIRDLKIIFNLKNWTLNITQPLINKIFFGDPTFIRDEDNSLYISGCKPYLMSLFYEVELDLKFTS